MVSERNVVLRPRLFAPHLRPRYRRSLSLLPLIIVGLARMTLLRGLAVVAAGAAVDASCSPSPRGSGSRSRTAWAHYWLTFFLLLVGGFFAAILALGIVDAIR